MDRPREPEPSGSCSQRPRACLMEVLHMTVTRGLFRLLSFALLLAIAAPGRAGMRAGAYVPDAPDAVPGVPRVAPTIAGEIVISFDGVVAPCAFEQTDRKSVV